MSDAAVLDNDSELSDIAEKISNLTLKRAKQLSDILKDKYGIEPAAGGAVMMAGPADGGGGAAAPAEKTEFNVVLTAHGDKKLDVVKYVKNLLGNSLIEAKKMVESCPATLKEGASKDDANKIKKELEEVGASVELK